MRESSPRALVSDGISIRCRVRKAPSVGRLEYGEPRDMVCSCVNWELADNQQQKRNRLLALGKKNKKVNDNSRSNSNNKRSPANKRLQGLGPTLYFHVRKGTAHTLEACCSLQSLGSCESTAYSPTTTTEDDDAASITDANNNKKTKRKSAFSVATCDIKTVEKTASLFRGYRIFFATGSKGSYELELENKNGCDILMALLQSALPAERFVSSAASVDGSVDTASYLSSLDVEKLTERLAIRAGNETMSEKLKKGVGHVVLSIEEMSSSFCGNLNICCGGIGPLISPSVAPYNPPAEVRDSPAPSRTVSPRFDGYSGPVMEIDEDSETIDSTEIDFGKKIQLKTFEFETEAPAPQQVLGSSG